MTQSRMNSRLERKALEDESERSLCVTAYAVQPKAPSGRLTKPEDPFSVDSTMLAADPIHHPMMSNAIQSSDIEILNFWHSAQSTSASPFHALFQSLALHLRVRFLMNATSAPINDMLPQHC